MKISTILVPLDGSALAEAALRPAVDLARDYQAKLVLVRAAEAHAFPIVDPTEAQVDAVRAAEEYLAGARERVTAAGLADVETAVWYGPPAEAIGEAARYRAADLIVMSSHGRSGLGRLVLGSVTETVLRTTYTPIFLVRPGEGLGDAAFLPAKAELANV
jgi:nucleotide-binding universal stress UspA family protein